MRNCLILISIAVTIAIARGFITANSRGGGLHSAFVTRSRHHTPLMNAPNQIEPVSQRDLTSRSLQNGFRYAAAISTAMVGFGIAAKPALATSLEDVNTKLSEYGLPPMLFLPNGFSPLVSEFGRGNIREAMSNPVLVQFAYPQLWVVQKTSVNTNGEAGTVAANDYIKGDSAFLFVQNNLQPTQTIPGMSKEYLSAFIRKGLTQKGDMVDSLKVFQVTKSNVAGQDYLYADFEYELNTEAGFLIDRRGVLSLTSAGKVAGQNIQGLFAVTTGKRWRQGLENKLRSVSESFRAYRLNSGVFAAE